MTRCDLCHDFIDPGPVVKVAVTFEQPGWKLCESWEICPPCGLMLKYRAENAAPNEPGGAA